MKAEETKVTKHGKIYNFLQFVCQIAFFSVLGYYTARLIELLASL